MDVSDSEEEPQRKKARNQLDGNQEDVERLQSLKEENDSLRCQLEAYKNEVRTIMRINFVEASRRRIFRKISRSLISTGGSLEIGNESRVGGEGEANEDAAANAEGYARTVDAVT